MLSILPHCYMSDTVRGMISKLFATLVLLEEVLECCIIVNPCFLENNRENDYLLLKNLIFSFNRKHLLPHRNIDSYVNEKS